MPMTETIANNEARLRAQFAQAMLGKAVVLDRMGKTDEARAAYDAVIQRFRSDPEPRIRQQVTEALYALYLMQRQESESAGLVTLTK
ncbi:hypothetical protein F11_09570 [Rhodospirillum rubrum F11]|uniref:Tetratricopeptide repeat protein n=2 Tax=Rhodospirillum rubrum TaxID=1085 RepID=Q2RT83_RHORT|nr:hypothetical protein Rru_A1862 [Rhodospirillum rubrum ATCC 11170]AEO48380.1 hypothetical protein F11_09570 [Rhodospirillum rubrum F11]MBK5954259.1 hypothetical protein [Rhodospirillum rubrum]QXG82283.1 hypothetical protein KUL73_09635 [Rhodospirillum rubrum]HCF16469.1 hypothetical protein [Rhodospirillum rubrum]